MNTVKVYGTGSASANAVASVVIPNKTRIRQVQFSVWMDSVTDNSGIKIEISRASAREIDVNGAQQAIAEVSGYNNLGAAGVGICVINQVVPCDIPVIQGQIIYLHATIAGTVTYFATAILHYE